MDQFKKNFATQLGRSGGASAAANLNVRLELWGQDGGWMSMDAQKPYMKSDPDKLLSVSRASMGLPVNPAPAVRIEGVSAGVPPHQAEGVPNVRIEGVSDGVPPHMADEGLLPEVVGVQVEAFMYS